jgi:hypothetical protein
MQPPHPHSPFVGVLALPSQAYINEGSSPSSTKESSVVQWSSGPRTPRKPPGLTRPVSQTSLTLFTVLGSGNLRDAIGIMKEVEVLSEETHGTEHLYSICRGQYVIDWEDELAWQW